MSKLIEIKIDPEFRDMIPAMPTEDFEGLKADILRDGYVRDPLVVWKEENILLDGHHRWTVILENFDMLSDKFSVDYKSFPDRYACIAWICANQLHKHNMDERQKRKLIQEEYEARQKSWNESMWQKMADFNAEQAQLNREWQERMDNTKYQRAIKDMETAGLNPILAVTGGGVSASGLGGSSASVSAPSMSGATGAMSSGGLLGADSASISNYSGQMEYMGGMLGLLSAAISGISSAMSAMGGMGKFGEALGDAIGDIFSKPKEAVQETAKQTRDAINSVTPDSIEGTKNGYRNGVKWQNWKHEHGS